MDNKRSRNDEDDGEDMAEGKARRAHIAACQRCNMVVDFAMQLYVCIDCLDTLHMCEGCCELHR